MSNVAKNACIYKKVIDIHKRIIIQRKRKKSFSNPYNNNRVNTNRTYFLTPCNFFVHVFFYYKEIKCLYITKLRCTTSNQAAAHILWVYEGKKNISFLKIVNEIWFYSLDRHLPSVH